MGFRNYDPGLNRFLTRDMYNGALADMTLGSDPYTGNRYSFAGGNPISFVELDGHLFGIDISISDIGHAALDVAGQVPVIGEIADGANAIWYAAEGNWVDAGLSAAGMIPFAGGVVTGARLASKTAKAVDTIADGAKAADNVADGAKAADNPPSGAGTKTDAPKKEASCPATTFVPGTKVVTADGSTKNIEDLKVGEQVLATDPETGDTRTRTVTNTRSDKGGKDLVTLTVDPDGKDGKAKPGKVTSTAAHLYWLPDAGKWVEADQLEPGMWLQTSAGTWIQITAIDDSRRSERVHNLTVSGVHTFYVAAGATTVLVHNNNCQAQADLAQMRKDLDMKSVAQEDAARAINKSAKAHTLGRMDFDGGRSSIYGMNGKFDRPVPFPGKGNRMTQTSYEDHAEGDMVTQALQKGYSGGNAKIYTDRDTCNWCKNSMAGYAQQLDLDSLEVFGPNGLVGTYTRAANKFVRV